MMPLAQVEARQSARLSAYDAEEISNELKRMEAKMAQRFHRRRETARTMPTRKQQTKIPLESMRRKKLTTNQWRKRKI
jgi:ribosomal protein L22